MKVGMQMERKHQADLNADTKRLEDQLNRAAQAAKERGNAAEAAALKRAADALKQGQTQAQQAQAQSELQKNSPADAAPPQDKAANALDKRHRPRRKPPIRTTIRRKPPRKDWKPPHSDCAIWQPSSGKRQSADQAEPQLGAKQSPCRKRKGHCK